MRTSRLLLGVTIVCASGFLLVATDVILPFKNSAKLWLLEDFRPEIAGFFLDGIMFVGVLGLVHYMSDRARVAKLKASLNAPVEKMLAELMVRFIDDNADFAFFTMARTRRVSPLNVRDGMIDSWFELRPGEKEKLLEIVEANQNRLEAVLPAAAQVNDEYVRQYLSVLDLMGHVTRGTTEVDKATVVHILDLVEEMGGSFNKDYVTMARIDKAFNG